MAGRLDGMDALTGRIDASLQALGSALRARGWRLATAESCTGGLVAAACTSLAGSSDWYDRGVVTYSNAAKTAQLGVDPAVLLAHGAVSAPVAAAMAEGALALGGVQIAVSVTGIAGPGGAVPGKPVGTVWFATAALGLPTQAVCKLLPGDRAAVRAAAVACALQLVLDRLDAAKAAPHA